jgi:hypothetical protein
MPFFVVDTSNDPPPLSITDGLDWLEQSGLWLELSPDGERLFLCGPAEKRTEPIRAWIRDNRLGLLRRLRRGIPNGRIAFGESPGSEDTFVSSARANRLPRCVPRLTMPSGVLVDDPNPHVRGLITRWQAGHTGTVPDLVALYEWWQQEGCPLTVVSDTEGGAV